MLFRRVNDGCHQVFVAQVEALYVRHHLTDAPNSAPGTALDLGHRIFGFRLDRTEANNTVRILADGLHNVIVGLPAEFRACPTDIERNRHIDAILIHTGNEIVGGGEFCGGVRIESLKAGVVPHKVVASFFYPWGNDVGMEIDDHTGIIASCFFAGQFLR